MQGLPAGAQQAVINRIPRQRMAELVHAGRPIQTDEVPAHQNFHMVCRLAALIRGPGQLFGGEPGAGGSGDFQYRPGPAVQAVDPVHEQILDGDR